MMFLHIPSFKTSSLSVCLDEDSSLSALRLKRLRTSRRMLLYAGIELHRSTINIQFVCYYISLSKMSHSTQCNVSYWHSFSIFLTCWYFVFVLHFRCRTLSGSPRPKSFKKVHFIKNMRQHDMRNGRYGGKQRCPLVNTSPQWIMANCPQSMNCSLDVSHITHLRRAGLAHSQHVIQI